MALESIFGLFALFMLVAQVVTCAIAAWRCRANNRIARSKSRAGRVSLIRTVCGIERFPETLESGFLLDHANYELLFCVARGDDPVVPTIHALLNRYPQANARLLIGDDRISTNPKLNNMVKGWRESTGVWVIFADSNIILPTDYIARMQTAWQSDTGLVSAPPAGGAPANWWSEIECALLNSHQARWQYVVDTFGFGFGQGKNLTFRREQLAKMGFEGLAAEPAEDAAATKLVRKSGLKVRLASPPFMQPLGWRSWKEVWGRHLRWARLRRMTFGIFFSPEILAGALLPTLAAVSFAMSRDISPDIVASAYLVAWYGSEYALATVAGWPATVRSVVSFVARDLMLPVLWVAALFGERVAWNGVSIPLQRSTGASDS